MPRCEALLRLALLAAAIAGASGARRPSERRAPLASFLADRPPLPAGAAADLPVLAGPRADASSAGQEHLAGLALPQKEPHHGHGEAHGHAEPDHGHGHGHAEEAHDDHGHSHAAAEDHGHDDAHHTESGHGHEHDHGHGEGHGHEHLSGPGAHSVAVGLIATVVIVPIIMFMAMSDWIIATLTFKMLDTFVSIFLAVLWFNTFAQFLDTFNIKEAFPLAREFFSLVQCLVLYAIALAIAYLWRNEKLTMTTFCSVGAHFIAFSGIMASTQTQKTVSKIPPRDWEPAASFGFCLFVMAFIAGISAMTWFAWRRGVKHESMNHAIEHLELDIVGLVLSFAITQAVRHAIMGRYPPVGHLLLQGAASGHHGPEHKDWQVWFMFLWASGLTVLAGVSLPKLSKLAEYGPWAERGVHVMKVVLIMLVAWGYLLWGEWEFYERLFTGDVMFGHMVFSCLATLVCLLVLYCMAILQGRLRSPQARETQDITITGISLVAAWSWEHCFNIAFDVIGQEYEVGYGGLVPKLVLAVVIPVVLLPTYVTHIRARVMEIEKHEHGHGHGEEGHGHEEHAEGHAEEHAEQQPPSVEDVWMTPALTPREEAPGSEVVAEYIGSPPSQALQSAREQAAS